MTWHTMCESLIDMIPLRDFYEQKKKPEIVPKCWYGIRKKYFYKGFVAVWFMPECYRKFVHLNSRNSSWLLNFSLYK